MRNPVFKSILSEEDFKSVMSAHPTFTETPPNNDEWTYLDTEQAVHINTPSGREGYALTPLGKVYAGDTVELSAEFLTISGMKPRIAVEWYSDENYSLNRTTVFISSDNDNEYRKTSFTYTVMSDGYIRATYGVWTNHTGEFKMRKLLSKINTIKTTTKKEFEIRKATIWNDTGGSTFTVKSGKNNDPCTISFHASISNTIVVEFDDRLNYSGIPIVSNEWFSNSNSYIVKASYGNNRSVSIQFFRFDDLTTKVDLETLPKEIYVNVMLIG